MSKHYDVIVLGIGGMGSAACYHLAKRGVNVLGLEQFKIGHDRGSSHGETRIIRRAYFEHSNYIPLLNRAYALWDELEKESGESLFVRNGMLVYGNPATSSVYRGTIESAAQYKIPVEALDREEARQRFPMYEPPPGTKAVFEPDAGFLWVEKSVERHARLALGHGATIHENESVLEYSATSNGIEVRTQLGAYSAAKLVIAGGGWNTKLLQKLNLPLQLRRKLLHWFKADATHALNASKVPCFAFHLEDDFYYGFPMLDGKTVKVAAHFSYDLISRPEEKAEAASLAEEEKKIAAVQAFIRKCMPGVSTVVDRSATCIYTMTPDEHFILDLHPEHSNVVIAAGFSGHGFKFSSVVGEVLADLAITGGTRHPIDFLRLREFKRP